MIAFAATGGYSPALRDLSRLSLTELRARWLTMRKNASHASSGYQSPEVMLPGLSWERLVADLLDGGRS